MSELEPEVGTPEWVKDWTEKRVEKRMSYASSMKDLRIFLKDLGYKYIRVWYEGAGDSGEAFHAEGWKKEIDTESKDDNGYYPDTYQHKPWNHAKKDDFDEWEGMNRNQKELEEHYRLFKKSYPLKNLQDELRYQLVDMINYDWYNNEGGQGELVWDLNEGTFVCNGQQNRYACVDVTEKYYEDGRTPVNTYGDEVYEK
tara:strand:+ start:3249 stop:3845 length:597 start_codon:yes stop_codon:yes gene_type:complete